MALGLAANRIDAHIGRRLREMRLTRDLTQIELARRLGIDVSLLRDHENGIARIEPEGMFALARLLDAPISAFFDGLIVRLGSLASDRA